jgi:drug/metabolite transporter (DMT)-like permease
VTRRGLILFASLSIIWGMPYLFIKISVEYLSPGMVIFSRLLLAAIILVPIVLAKGQFSALRGHWRWVFVFAIVEMTFTWWFLAYAEQHITSSLTGLLIATVPIITALLGKAVGLDDRLTGSRLFGMGVGFAGVIALVGLDVKGSEFLAVAALTVTALGYALGPIVIDRKLSTIPALPVIAASIVINAIIYAPIAWFTRPTAPVPASAWWSVVALGLICTALAFIIFFALIAEVGPSRTTFITYINPAVAVILGVIVLSEPLTWGIIIGFPLVLIGSWMATRKAPAMESEPHA